MSFIFLVHKNKEREKEMSSRIIRTLPANKMHLIINKFFFFLFILMMKKQNQYVHVQDEDKNKIKRTACEMSDVLLVVCVPMYMCVRRNKNINKRRQQVLK